jgi:hypothetical protein
MTLGQRSANGQPPFEGAARAGAASGPPSSAVADGTELMSSFV